MRLLPAFLPVVSLFLIRATAAPPSAPGEVDFASEIVPVLERSCVSCHGAERQKGDLRLDAREHWLAGGSEGPAFVPGKPEKSSIVERISLPKDHDDVMPPDGKADYLKPEEVEAIRRWIAKGGDWPAGVVIQSGKVESADERAARIGPEPSPLERTVMAELARKGAKAVPLAHGIHWRRVDLRTSPDFNPSILRELAMLRCLREMNVAGLDLSDDALAPLAQAKNLAVLHLENTKAGDAAVAHLAGLSELTYLNLFGTTVSDASVAHLSKLTKLKSLFLAGTKVTPAGLAELKKALPHAEIDGGVEFAEVTKPDPPAPKAAPSTPAPSATKAKPAR